MDYPRTTKVFPETASTCRFFFFVGTFFYPPVFFRFCPFALDCCGRDLRSIAAAALDRSANCGVAQLAPTFYPLLSVFIPPMAAAAAIPQRHVETSIRAMVLYESFRPMIASGKAGWGQSGMFRLATVLKLRDELVREGVDGRGGACDGDGGDRQGQTRASSSSK